jgi:hypothetical protein
MTTLTIRLRITYRRVILLGIVLPLFCSAQVIAGGLLPKTRGMPLYPDNHPLSRLGVSFELSQSLRDVEEYDDRLLFGGERDTSGSVELQAALLDVSYRVLPWTSVALKLGFVSADFEDFSTQGYEHSYDLGPVWGFGMCQRLLQEPRYGISVDTVFEYIQGSPDEWDTLTSSGILTSFDPFVETWHLDVLATKEWGRLAGYTGLRYSDLILKYEHPSNDYESGTRQGGFEATDHVGLFGGVSYIVADGVVVDAEISLIDSMGLYLGASYQF